jgi:hypothetical protein
MNFRVGQKVVCIEDRWVTRSPTPFPMPSKGSVSTVTEILQRVGYSYGVQLRLAEFGTGVFVADHFRHAIDISVFTAILTKTRKENLRLARRPVKEDA